MFFYKIKKQILNHSQKDEEKNEFLKKFCRNLGLVIHLHFFKIISHKKMNILISLSFSLNLNRLVLFFYAQSFYQFLAFFIYFLLLAPRLACADSVCDSGGLAGGPPLLSLSVRPSVR